MAIPAMGPLCERSKNCSCSAMRSTNKMRNWRSTHDAASCCQPRLAPKLVDIMGGKSQTIRGSVHMGGSKPSTPINSRCPGCCMQRKTLNPACPESRLGAGSVPKTQIWRAKYFPETQREEELAEGKRRLETRRAETAAQPIPQPTITRTDEMTHLRSQVAQ